MAQDKEIKEKSGEASASTEAADVRADSLAARLADIKSQSGTPDLGDAPADVPKPPSIPGGKLEAKITPTSAPGTLPPPIPSPKSSTTDVPPPIPAKPEPKPATAAFPDMSRNQEPVKSEQTTKPENPTLDVSAMATITQIPAQAGATALAAAVAPPEPDEEPEAEPTPDKKPEPEIAKADTKADAKPKTEPQLDDLIGDAAEEEETPAPSRREARRRPAGPVRERFAANDDAPTIGGLIYALQQKPSSKPFQYAAIGSTVWAMLGAFALWLNLSAKPDPYAALVSDPMTFLTITAVIVPIIVIWFLALLAWRSEELRLRSSTMAEVAIRLAEPDRMAEQSTASLGQAVRRQVSFMNDAVSRAIGRAGELEALVHNEVSILERSYDENERKIQGLIKELSNERNALQRTGDDVHTTLKSIGSEVPALIEKLSNQQLKLAQIIEGAGANLTMLETSLSQGARQLETTVDSSTKQIESALVGRTEQLEIVLDSYTGAVDGALSARTEQMQTMLSDHTKSLGHALSTTTEGLDQTLETHSTELRTMLTDHSSRMGEALGGTTTEMQDMLGVYTSALAEALSSRTEEMQEAFEGYMLTLDTSISNRTENLQSVFEEYAQALDTTLANRAEALDQQLVARTRALDDAFSDRLRLFDETIVRTTSAIDEAVGEKAIALTSALDDHARNFQDTITRQTADIDDTLSNGISAVRRSSENVTRQSLKAIEGLASQSDMLKRVSENLLGQINSVTNRFENQGQLIMQAANALESANYKIDSTLKQRHNELSGTLHQLNDKADEFSEFVEGYSTNIAGQISEAEQRAKAAAEELRQGTHLHQRQALEDLERFKSEAGQESQRALSDLRERFSSVSKEMQTQFGSLSNRFDETTNEVRERAQQASKAIEEEQARLREKLELIPNNTRESAEAMRRSLQDQLKALDQLSEIATREGRSRDVSSPDATSAGGPGIGRPSRPSPSGSLSTSYAQNNAANRAETERQLSSLSSSLARELHARPLRGSNRPEPSSQKPASPDVTQAANPTAPNTGSVNPAGPGNTPSPQDLAAAKGHNWSVGDLLKRASEDDAAGPKPSTPDHGGPSQIAPSHQSPNQARPTPAPQSSLPDVSLMVKAIEPSTAKEIWARLRAGQRGILVPSLYPPAIRASFDELSRRYANEPPLREAISRFLADFENTIRNAEKTDPSGQLIQSHLLSDMGRAYLFLAHVSGRLDK
ncbi:MAG: hypothetical protein RIC14_15510 [Filomicrobium sp.]